MRNGFRKKWICMIIGSCLMMLIGWSTAEFFANATNGVSPAATVSYSASSDVLMVSGFKFYTTTNASKRVPAANCWVKTDENSSGTWGVLELSGNQSAATLYFSKSATPASTDEILAVKIPAQQVLSKVKYKPAETKLVETASGDEEEVDGDITDKFEFYTKVKLKKDGATQTVEIPVDPQYIQVRLSDNDSWKAFKDVMTKKVLEKMQRYGRTIYVRIAPAAAVTTTDTVDDVRQILDRSLKNEDGVKVGRFEEEVSASYAMAAAGIVRPGVSKTVRIARRALGPVVSIDYANHALNIKSGQAYGQASAEAVEPKVWTSAEDAGKAFFGVNGYVGSDMIYGLKRMSDTDKGVPDSLTTFFKVPKDKPLLSYDQSAAKNETYVSVTGTYGEDALLRIQNKIAGTAVSFQYAIVDLKKGGANEGLLDGVRFRYDVAMEQAEGGALKWNVLKTAKSTGKVLTKISSKLLAGKQIIIRRAAAGKEYSSKLEIFRAPLEKGKGWYKIAQQSYTDLFTSGGSPLGTCACPYADITYKADSKTKNQFKIVRSASSSALVADKLSVNVGTEENVPFSISGDVVTLTGVTGFAQGEKVVFALKEGCIAAPAANGMANAEYKIIVVPNP